MVTKTAVRPPVIEEAGPLPGNRALVPLATAPLQRIDAAPSCNPYAADWALEDFLRQAGFDLINYEAARQKMTSLADWYSRRWGWFPLREQDRGGDAEAGQGGLTDTVYPRPIPQAGWTLVSRIESGFGRRVRFFVSHYHARSPDPFLAVTCTGLELYVIAEWLKPGRHEPLQRQRRKLPLAYYAAVPAARQQATRRGKPFAAVLFYWTVMSMLLVTAGWCVAQMARAYGVAP